ncbi:unnamed protein product [Microthlaspi erraticum]|uniref:F-box domain-containing protein n=1 Tax=Microthlaspi erraticum TaxID=1685480 RepID=A0A6D2KS37_9BRAS|nr:unnamed protein product [Microthlaspi erraticum]
MRRKRHKKAKKPRSQSSSTTSVDNSLPTDLIFEIFSRLPAKSIAKFHCVSKQWTSILDRPDFTDHFLKMSSSRPCLLFTFKVGGKWLFFSAPQPLNPDQNSSSLAVDGHMSSPTITCSLYIHAPVCGFLCAKDLWLGSGCEDPRGMIYNPSTGQFITLPKVRTRRVDVRTYFGFDPINKQFKVLCMTVCRKPRKETAEEYQVLTLGTEEKLSWRMIECSLPHKPMCMCRGICIDGVLYYCASFDKLSPFSYAIVCFDVKHETFRFIENVQKTWLSVLINCKGKLGVLCCNDGLGISRRTTSLELHVLDDVEKQKWSYHSYTLPPQLENLFVGDISLGIVGMTCNGEIVFSQRRLHDPFYIYYYNVEKNTIVRVRIQGIGPAKGQWISTFIDHLENVKRMREYWF